MHAWLLDRYWLFAGLIVIWSTPLVAFAGGLTDVLGVSVFGALSVAGWFGARWSRGVAVRVHLAALVLGWAWYSSLADGLPARVDRGGAAFGAMIMLPVLVSVAIDGPRGASTMGTLALLSALARFGFALDAAVAAFLVGMGVIVGLTFHRQTETMKKANDRLVRIATHDVITELPTRRVLQERLRQVERGALLVIGIRRFKTVNDVYGHAAGDALLRLVGARLNHEVGAAVKPERAPFLAYLGGDSFGLLLPEVDEEAARAVASQVLQALEVPFEQAERSIQIGGRVGLVVWPAEGVTPSTLLSCGDRAAARARQSPDHLVAFDPSVDREPDRTLEVELTRAIEQRELVPFYQAVCDLSSGEMVGLEALVRWNHPSRGLLSPFAFVECAEMNGQIVHLDRYMLRAIAAQLHDWRRHGFKAWVAVNVSARTVDDPTFLAFVRDVLAERPELSGSIVLEVTESTAMRDPERATRTLEAIRELGVRVALDDFGMGHSSLAYLKRFPVDHLKLDRLFVSGIGSSARDEALLEILLGLAKQFGMEVIAEGIETPDQLRWLTARGCGFAQGFLFSKPMPAAEIPVVRSRVSGVYATEVRGSAPSLGDVGSGI